MISIYQQVLGFIAGALIMGSMVPQVWRLYKLKSAREISLLFTLLLTLGSLSWLIYGIWLTLPPIIIWNVIGVLISAAMIIAKLKYGR